MEASAAARGVDLLAASCKEWRAFSEQSVRNSSNEVLEQVELDDTTVEWKFLKYVQEPEFGS